jgi:hypothetical protein
VVLTHIGGNQSSSAFDPRPSLLDRCHSAGYSISRLDLDAINVTVPRG